MADSVQNLSFRTIAVIIKILFNNKIRNNNLSNFIETEYC